MARGVVPRRMQNIQTELSTAWLGHPTTVLATVDSTNRWLKARPQALHGEAVWADEQTQGRGRLGRGWESPPGSNIYTSVLIRPPKERLSGVISLAAGVGVVWAVNRITQLSTRIKWPNDLVAGGRKFSGILVEAGTGAEPWAIIGIGINVNGSPSDRFPGATSLASLAGHVWSREDLWLMVMHALEEVIEAWLWQGDDWVVAAWNQVNATLGQEVAVHQAGHAPWIGLAHHIDPDGGLWVQRDTGLEKVIAGEVSLRLADGSYAPDNV